MNDLYTVLEERFSREELRILCSNLDVDFDDLHGGSNDSKIRELISFMLRRGRLNDLAHAIDSMRSDALVNVFEHYFQSPSMESFEVIKTPSPGEPPLTDDA